MKTIRASEIGHYLYCQRAWWYHRQGAPSENVEEMAAGSEMHQRHGRAVMTNGCLQIVGYTLLLAALVIAAVALTGQMP